MLLRNREFTDRLQKKIDSAASRVVIASAFIKADALRYLLSSVSAKQILVIARWQKRDLVAKASDLDVYRICKERGWDFGINLSLHGKIYCIDAGDIFLGSSNLTHSGLGYAENSNLEFGTQLEPNSVDLNKVESFINKDVVWINDEEFKLIQLEVEASIDQEEEVIKCAWSNKLTGIMKSNVNYLWVNTLPFCSPRDLLKLNLEDQSMLHDFQLLGLNIDDLNGEAIRSAFRNMSVYKWVTSLLKDRGSLSFGALSSELHSALLDDPKPFRRDVKNLVSTLFDWFEFLAEDFLIVKHRHTKSVCIALSSSKC